MQRSTMSRHLSEDAVLGFLKSDNSEKEEEISDSNWISGDDGEEDRKEISSCNKW